MQKYKDFSPTPLDPCGLNAGDQGDWLVAPCSLNRNASILYRANWKTLLADLERVDPEGNDYQVNRYGHWACGWFEIILIRPGSKCEQVGIEAEGSLADYPVLSDEDYGQEEMDAFSESWDNWLARDAADSLIKCMEQSDGVSPEFIDDFEVDPDKYILAQALDEMLMDACNYEMHEDGPSVNYYDFTEVFKHLNLPIDPQPIFEG